MSSLAIFVDVSKLPPAGSAPPVMQVFPGKLVATRVPVAVPTDQDGAAIFAALNSTLHLKRSLGDAATTVMPFNSTGDFASMIDTEIESRSQPSESAANVGDAPR